MIKKSVNILIIFTVIITGISYGQPSNQQSNQINETKLKSVSLNNNSSEIVNKTPGSANLSYIWSITGLEPGQVIMAINQDDDKLFGKAKYEPDNGGPWNGIVIGSVSGDDVEMVLTTNQESGQSSFEMHGIFYESNQTLKGEFFQVDEGKIKSKGSFEALWINPDTSSYTPATIAEPKTETLSLSNSTSTIEPGTFNQINQQIPQTRYHDVHQDADKILTGVGDISQIPIGMGGSGLP